MNVTGLGHQMGVVGRLEACIKAVVEDEVVSVFGLLWMVVK